MEKLIINGGRRLGGEVRLQGSKNSILPILAATAAVNGVSVIHNCPCLTDVEAAVKILKHIGCKVNFEGDTIIVDASCAARCDIPEFLMHEMRSSIIFLGALLTRFGKATVAAPGGCEIGLRPIDLHLSSLKQMGTEISEFCGTISCCTKGGLKGCRISLGFPSVGATENIILASLGASGETVITNAAREPEIKDLADFLNKCGARIFGAGQSVIRILPSDKLTPAEHTVIPDRIVASTYMAYAACTGSTLTVSGVCREHLMPVIPAFEEAGCRVMFYDNSLSISAPERLHRIKYIRTMPYPGFPTDCQAIMMSVCVLGTGTSVISENIFENRFRHVPELVKMGADIRVENGKTAVIEGVKKLYPACVAATDLRGGTALIAAALSAEGKTEIYNSCYVYRGCTEIVKTLSMLGADITEE